MHLYTEAYNWCTVPYSGADVLVVAGLAVVVACLLHGKWSMLLTLIVGMLCGFQALGEAATQQGVDFFSLGNRSPPAFACPTRQLTTRWS